MQGNATVPRYALYYAPDQADPLTKAAEEWLGRDVFSGKDTDRSSMIQGVDTDQFNASLSSARRYGFHGTLKAPFHLAEGKSLADLEAAVEAYGAETQAFDLPPLEVGQLGPFFALRPVQPDPALASFAASVVRTFEPFRAPLSPEDIARRNPDKLSPSQRENLMNWGYPYIFEDFRFHMTLSDPIDAAIADHYHTALKNHFDPLLATPRKVSALSIFVEPQRGAPFTLHRQIPLTGPTPPQV